MLEIINGIIKEEFPLAETRLCLDLLQVNIKSHHETTTLNFEIFFTDKGLVTQRFTPHSHRAQRLVTDISDPQSFQKITNFINFQRLGGSQ